MSGLPFDKTDGGVAATHRQAGVEARPAKRMAEALAGGGTDESRARRADHDFFPTPPEVIEALVRECGWLRREYWRRLGVRPVVWEPSCGEGAIAERLAREGWQVAATDIKDRGYGMGGVDFLTAPYPLPLCTGVAAFDRGWPIAAIVMNPPFNQALWHVVRALDLLERGHVKRVACLLGGEFWARAKTVAIPLKTAASRDALSAPLIQTIAGGPFWERVKHRSLFEAAPPATVMPLAWKPDFTGGGSGIFTVQWSIWQSRPGHKGTRFKPLARPVMGAQADLLATDDGGTGSGPEGRDGGPGGQPAPLEAKP